jgi:hypothetical protein
MTSHVAVRGESRRFGGKTCEYDNPEGGGEQAGTGPQPVFSLYPENCCARRLRIDARSPAVARVLNVRSVGMERT